MRLSTVIIAGIAAGVTVLGVTGTANAQGTGATINPLLPTKGTREISLSGNLGFQPNHNYDVNVGYGPFLNRNVQVGGQLGFSRDDKVTNGTYGVFGNYHFPSASAFLPYVGLNLGGQSQKISGSKNDTTFAIGAQAGVKYFLNPNVAINPELYYTNPTKSGLKDTFALRLGIGVYLR